MVHLSVMANTFFFYDLETSGINPQTSRIMQFAGQRTTLELEAIGEPFNILVKLSPDVVPDPDAILITGITPQQTLQDGITEAEFLKIFSKEVSIPGTIFVGYNTVRFDDEFIRFMQYRNFYDPYEWQWKDNRSRWDLLDVVRMTRALRPEGITWPFDSTGKASNRLQLLTGANGLDHEAAHDALSDVSATIALARLLYEKQPKLFRFLLEMRDKRKVESLALDGKPFVYTSGKYQNEYEKTTVVTSLARHPKKQGAFVYDLRYDPRKYVNKTPEQLAELWRWKKDAVEPRLPVKTLQYNRCPAVAPLTVLDTASRERLQIDMITIEQNMVELSKMTDFPEKLLKAFEILDSHQQTEFLANPKTVDGQLYDGFIGNYDKTIEEDVRQSSPDVLNSFGTKLHDPRLQELLPLYKARNYPGELTHEERVAWEKYREEALLGGGDKSRLAKYFARLAELDQAEWITDKQRFVLEELQLYGQAILPVDQDAYDETDEH